jgi:hypothetical protein
MRALVSRLVRDRRGVSAMEFALILPMLVMFSAGTIEYSRMILLTQKLQSGAFILADLTARDKTLETDQLEDIFLAIGEVIRPFDFDGNGQATITSIGADEDDELILNWQCPPDAESRLVEPDGDVLALPGDITLKHGETVIAAEVFFDFDPLFGALFGIGLTPRVIHRSALYKPRLGVLDDLDCPAA